MATACSGAFFSPHSYFIFIPETNIEQGVIQGNPENSTVAGLAASARHESAHWLQCLGTTVGQFLCFIREAQVRSVYENLPRIQSSVRRRLVEERVGGKSLPLIRVAGRGAINTEDVSKNKEYAWFARMWYELVLTEHLFSRTERQSGIIAADVRKDHIFADASADLLLYFNSAYKNIESESEARELRNWYRPIGSEGDLMDAAHVRQEDHFSADDIMECAATLDQLCYLAILEEAGVAPAFDEPVEKIIQSLRETRYGKPIRALASVCPDVFDNLLDYIPAIMAICDLSLNPPLAPLVHPGVQISKNWQRWDNLSPFLRFLKFARILPRMRKLPRGSAGLDVVYFQGDLCSAADVLNPFEYMQNSLEADNLERAVGAGNHINVVPGSRSEFAKFVGNKMLKLRKVAPELFWHPSDARQYSKTVAAILNRGDLQEFYRICFDAPLWAVGKQNVTLGFPRQKANWVIAHSIHNAALHQFVCGSGPIVLKNIVSDEAITVAGLMRDRGVFDNLGGIETGNARSLFVSSNDPR